MTGSAVRWLQARLTDLGYLRRGDASGEFDEHTVGAVQSFQRRHGLDASGEVGPGTLIALYQALDYGAPRLVSGGDLSWAPFWTRSARCSGSATARPTTCVRR